MTEPTHCDCGHKYNKYDIERNKSCVGNDYEFWNCETCEIMSDPDTGDWDE